MMMIGAAATVGVYMTLCEMSKNKNKIKSKVNSIIDDTADMFN